MNKPANYVAKVKRLRLKRKVSELLPHFFNPSATVFLITIAFDDFFQQPVLVPARDLDSLDYMSFIGKNNERSLNVKEINFCFKERLSKNLRVLFFLVEYHGLGLRFSIQNIFEKFNKNIVEINKEAPYSKLDKCLLALEEKLKMDLTALGCEMLLLTEIKLPVEELTKGLDLDYEDDYLELNLNLKERLI